jgi:cbb3-type cytochrome oxidase subunit 1
MEWFVKAFLKSSLAWLALGVTLGVAMAAHPVWTVYRLAHVHMMLLGFVTMMIYGVAYHVIPHVAGFRLRHPAAARAHWWISNAGLVMMVAGFVLRVRVPDAGTAVLATGGTLSAFGAYVFVYLMWRTIDGPARLRKGATRARVAQTRADAGSGRVLTVVQPATGPRPLP